MKTVILTNVGTPQSASPEDVGIYLREFLMDEGILQIPRPFRDILVKGLIVPRRKLSSAHKYQKIWTEQGSPLMVESKSLKSKLEKKLGSDFEVHLGMQVGQPALKTALQSAVQKNSEIYFCPLYPQYANATTGGALKMLKSQVGPDFKVKLLKPFFQKEWFIKAQARIIFENLTARDHLLLSYHGLPISQLTRQNPGCYSSSDCCASAQSCELNCYKAQCLKTSEILKRELSLTQISTGFQSRLGPTKWIEPSTETVVMDLLKQGVKHIKVACPSFVADCLETLEEIGLDLRQKFLAAGGQGFELIPCVNSNEDFVQGLANEILSLSE
jgi:ferrochelatase